MYKIFRYDQSVPKEEITILFSGFETYFFSSVCIVCIGFNNDEDIPKMFEKAISLDMRPVIVTNPRFLLILDEFLNSGLELAEIQFVPDINTEEQQELNNLINNFDSEKQAIRYYIERVLKGDNNFIRTMEWRRNQEKLIIEDNGIVQTDDELLKYAELQLSTAIA